MVVFALVFTLMLFLTADGENIVLQRDIDLILGQAGSFGGDLNLAVVFTHIHRWGERAKRLVEVAKRPQVEPAEHIVKELIEISM
jgi:hypothetical protein